MLQALDSISKQGPFLLYALQKVNVHALNQCFLQRSVLEHLVLAKKKSNSVFFLQHSHISGFLYMLLWIFI